jgi:steroid delta-isomerase-like uncharacterized protein
MKRLLIFAGVLLCASSAWAGTVQDRNKAIARRVFEEIFNQGKYEVANEIYAANFVNHGLHRNADLKEGQDAVRGWKQVFPDLKMTVVKEIAEGDLVTVLWTFTGTNTGEGNGILATGKKVEARGITIWRIVNGRITEEWSEWDQLGPMQQLGLIPVDSKKN